MTAPLTAPLTAPPVDTDTVPADTPRGLDEIIEALYAGPNDGFTAARDLAAAQARSRGDQALAAAVKALRRPTRSAWLVNQLMRRRPGFVEELSALGTALRDAEQTSTGPQRRSLGARRSRLVAALVAEAAALTPADAAAPTADMLRDVQATLEAILADPQAAGEVRGGRLVHPLAGTGFAALTAPRAAGSPATRPAAPTTQRDVRDRARTAARAAAATRLRAAEVALDAAEADAERTAREHAGLLEDFAEVRARVSDLERRAAESALDARAATRTLAAAREELRVARKAADRGSGVEGD